MRTAMDPDFFEDRAENEDPVRDLFIDNTDIANIIFELLNERDDRITESDHFNEFSITEFNHTLRIFDLQHFWESVLSGWEIGVYTEDDILAGGVIWNERVAFLTAFGDDRETEEVEGFTDQEEMTSTPTAP